MDRLAALDRLLTGKRWAPGDARTTQIVEEHDFGNGVTVVDAIVGTQRMVAPVVAEHGGFGDALDASRHPGATWQILSVLAGDRPPPPGFAVAGRCPGAMQPPLAIVSGEQSNTSIRVGGQFLFKWMRSAAIGRHPDVEVPGALAAAGFSGVAPPCAVLYKEDGPVTLALLGEYLDGAVDGWALFQHRPAEAPERVRVLGATTASLHRSLRSAFDWQEATGADARAWAESWENSLVRALDAAPEELGPLADRVRAVFNGALDVLTTSNAMAGPVQRVHGDYHLGQVLWVETGERFVVIDFEGEPALPLAERTAPSSPLVDVAGMVRSLDYARAAGGFTTGWADAARAAFVDGYGAVPGPPELLVALELRKALYEVTYEATYRPTWLEIPLSAVHALSTLAGQRRTSSRRC